MRGADAGLRAGGGGRDSDCAETRSFQAAGLRGDINICLRVSRKPPDMSPHGQSRKTSFLLLAFRAHIPSSTAAAPPLNTRLPARSYGLFSTRVSVVKWNNAVVPASALSAPSTSVVVLAHNFLVAATSPSAEQSA